MIRVLHLVRRDADLQTRYTIQKLHETLGGDGEFEFSTRVVDSLWNAIRLRRVRGRFDVAHAWDERSLAVARVAGFERVVFQGIALPPMDVDALTQASRQLLRKQLGLADDHFVLLTAGESTRAAAHERAVWVGSILHVTDERYRVLLWGRGPRLDVAAELGDNLRQPGLVVVAEHVLKRPIGFEELLPAADALLVTATAAAPTVPVAMAMSAGVPVVACERAELKALLTDGETSWNVPKCVVRPLAQRVLDLRADPAQAAELVQRARERVAEVGSHDRFADEFRRVYGGQLAATS